MGRFGQRGKGGFLCALDASTGDQLGFGSVVVVGCE